MGPQLVQHQVQGEQGAVQRPEGGRGGRGAGEFRCRGRESQGCIQSLVGITYRQTVLKMQ